MHRFVGFAILLFLCAGCFANRDDHEGFPLEPDPTYVPAEGDRVALYDADSAESEQGIPLLTDMTSYDKYERALREEDSQALEALKAEAKLDFTPTGTNIFLEKIHDRQHTGARMAAEVKLLDGRLQGKTFWTPIAKVARLRKPIPEPE